MGKIIFPKDEKKENPVYEGMISNLQMNGKGVLKKDNFVYDGFFKNDKMDGIITKMNNNKKVLE